jgi:hypothetical protein
MLTVTVLLIKLTNVLKLKGLKKMQVAHGQIQTEIKY